MALVLAGGGARGLAHIGVIRRLEELGLDADIVCGTSMGALIGGLWSMGWTGAQMDSLARRIDWEGSFSDTPAHNRLIGNARFLDQPDGLRLELDGWQIKPPGQLFRGNKVELLLSDLTQGAHGDLNFLDLPRAFSCAATDLERGLPVYLERGSLARALRASMSLPSVFEPVIIDGRVLVDGGLTQNLPTDLALRLGADLIIAVDLPVHLKPQHELNNLVAVADQSRQILSLAQERQAARLADIIIRPAVSHVGMTSFEPVDSLIQLGYQSVRAVEPELLALLAARGVGLVPDAPAPPCRQLPDSLWLASLNVEGNSTITLEQAERLLDLKRGDRFSPRTVSQRVRTFISSGLAMRAGYEIILLDPDAPPPPGQLQSAALILQVDGPSKAWLDLRPGYNEHDLVWLGLMLDWDRPRGPGTRMRLEGRFGGETRLNLGYWKSSFLNSGLYLHPFADYSSESVELKGESQRALASYELERSSVGLGSGIVLRRGARLEGDLSTEWARATPEIADSTWVRVREQAHAVGLTLDVDTRNSLDHPTHGFTLSAGSRLFRPVGRAGDPYSRAGLSARVWHTLAGLATRLRSESSPTAARDAGSIPYRSGLLTFEAGIEAGLDLRGELPAPFYFPLGGWPVMPGMAEQERWARRMASGWLGTRVWLGRFVSIMPVAAWWQSEGDFVLGADQHDVGFGVEMAARTLFGPLRLATGARPGEPWAVYLRLGWE